MGEDRPLELSGSDTDASSDEIQATLLSAVAREANSRAGATFAEMIGRVLVVHDPLAETARPKPKSAAGWRAGSPTDAAVAAPAAAASSSVAPSTTTAAAASSSVAADRPCPLSMLLPIEWDDVRIFVDESNTMRYDTKTSPLPLPHPKIARCPAFRGKLHDIK